MPATVLLKDIIEALDMQFDETPSYLNLDTGEVVAVSEDILHGEEDPDAPDWEIQERELGKQIVSTGRFRPLPAKFDVHEWGIMEEFVHSTKSASVRSELLRAIHRSGAFRTFQDTVRRLGIEPAWFAFRDNALRQIAIDWCDENQIAWK